ncbi:MAG: hypothetical protein IPG08_14725 [Sphingobacteriaceae bacterium]|nr:hypothetical protein [Sphingobacteriaceae bacterium]
MQIKFDGISLVDKSGAEVNGIKSGEEINFVIETQVGAKKVNNVGIAITIYSDEGIEMMTLANHIADKPFETVLEDNKIFCNINKFPLTKRRLCCQFKHVQRWHPSGLCKRRFFIHRL